MGDRTLAVIQVKDARYLEGTNRHAAIIPRYLMILSIRSNCFMVDARPRGDRCIMLKFMHVILFFCGLGYMKAHREG